MKKFFSLIIMFACCLFAFTGCCTISQSFVVNKDGIITESLRVQFDSTELIANEVDASIVANKAKQLAEDFKTSKQQFLGTEIGNAMEVVLTEQDNNYILNVDITYNTVESWYAFWELEIPTEVEYEYSRGWFFDQRIIYSGPTDFNSSFAENFTNQMTEFLNTTYPNYTIDLSKIKTNYLRAYNRTQPLPSADADYAITTDEYLIYVWEFDMANKNRTINIYQTVLTSHNKGNWFVTALGATLVFGLLLFAYLYNKKKNKKEDTPLMNDVLLKEMEQALAEIKKHENELGENKTTNDVEIIQPNKSKVNTKNAVEVEAQKIDENNTTNQQENSIAVSPQTPSKAKATNKKESIEKIIKQQEEEVKSKEQNTEKNNNTN